MDVNRRLVGEPHPNDISDLQAVSFAHTYMEIDGVRIPISMPVTSDNVWAHDNPIENRHAQVISDKQEILRLITESMDSETLFSWRSSRQQERIEPMPEMPDTMSPDELERIYPHIDMNHFRDNVPRPTISPANHYHTYKTEPGGDGWLKCTECGHELANASAEFCKDMGEIYKSLDESGMKLNRKYPDRMKHVRTSIADAMDKIRELHRDVCPVHPSERCVQADRLQQVSGQHLLVTRGIRAVELDI